LAEIEIEIERERENRKLSPKSFPAFSFYLSLRQQKAAGREKETNQSTKLYQMESRGREIKFRERERERESFQERLGQSKTPQRKEPGSARQNPSHVLFCHTLYPNQEAGVVRKNQSNQHYLHRIHPCQSSFTPPSLSPSLSQHVNVRRIDFDLSGAIHPSNIKIRKDQSTRTLKFELVLETLDLKLKKLYSFRLPFSFT
jgi:hypothetical protein